MPCTPLENLYFTHKYNQVEANAAAEDMHISIYLYINT